MAPIDAAKNLQGNRLRPTTRGIVPAIPLPYIQKRKVQVVAPKKTEEDSTSSSATAPEIPISTSQQTTGLSSAVINGSPDAAADTATQIGESSDTNLSATPAVDEEVTASGEPQEFAAQASLEDEAHPTPPLASSDNQSSGSRSTYNMPPPFIPASQSYSNSVAPEPVKFQRHPSFGNQHPMHHAHPSTGSLVFGGYPESNNSSPAPPLSANGMVHYQSQGYPENGRGPPPGPLPYFANGGHMHHPSHGFAQMGPPGPGAYQTRPDNYLNHNNGNDNYPRRQMVSFGPHDGYSPVGIPLGQENQRFSAHDPSNPQSFHGSQASVPNDQDTSGPGFYNQHPPAVTTNGSNGHVEEARTYHQPRQKARTGSQPALPPGNYAQPTIQQSSMPPAMDNLDGLMGYLQSQFGDPQFADYSLELRYSDDRATPVRIYGHNLLFARSPTLKHLMAAQAPSHDASALKTLFIETDDRFLRSDGFWLAAHRLYGAPLLDPGASATTTAVSAAQISAATPGTPADRFDLALGYAAAGHILQIPPVVNRGIDIASHFINWQTIEKALDFALDGGLDSQWSLDRNQGGPSPSTYGPAVSMLIHSAMTFMITTFPPNFELDTTVPDAIYNRRLPVVSDTSATPSSHRLSSIKFGDHSSGDEVVHRQDNSITSVLSKILINLPFQLLKYVLESSTLGNVQGWATTALKQKVMHAVIEEREKRRNKVRDSKGATNAERNANRKQWEAVGLQESLAPTYVQNETPTLIRIWVGFVPSGGD